MKQYNNDPRFWLFTTKVGKIIIGVFIVAVVIMILLEKMKLL